MPHNPRRPLINSCPIDFEMVYLVQHMFLSNYAALDVTIYSHRWNQSVKARPKRKNNKNAKQTSRKPIAQLAASAQRAGCLAFPRGHLQKR